MKSDLRIEKTKRAITNTFLELRSSRSLEKITIKELCEKALINKSTFYSHYKDIYDLSEQLENEVIISVLEQLSGVERLFEDPAGFTHDLFMSILASDSLIQILFSGTRSGELVRKIDYYVKQMLFQSYPELEHDLPKNVLISYTIYGSYYAFAENRQHNDMESIDIISTIIQESVKFL